MKILYLEEALEDLVWFHRYYSHIFPDGADRALKQFEASEETLSIHPYIGPENEDGARKLHIINTPFSYVYIVNDSHIEILRVLDNRRGKNQN